MDFNKMTLAELQKELTNYRTQLENQGYPITPAQQRRWKALSAAYKKANEDIAK